VHGDHILQFCQTLTIIPAVHYMSTSHGGRSHGRVPAASQAIFLVLPGSFFCSQAILGGRGGSQAPRSSQAPRASVAPNYRLPGSSQLVAQIPGSQELPAGNQNHALRAPRGCPLAAGRRGRDGELRKGTHARAARGPPSRGDFCRGSSDRSSRRRRGRRGIRWIVR
jgi:hypothetical protein